MRYFWSVVLLVSALALTACNTNEMGETSEEGAGVEATVVAPADTPVVEDTPTVAVAPSSDLTTTEGITGGIDMTDTGAMTETGAMTGTGATGATTGGMGGGLMISDSADYGQILTDSEGRTVYMFKNDTPDMSNCTGDCATNWPPVPASDMEAVAGEGLDQAMFGTIQRDDGSSQLTYNGYPLYYYAEDVNPGDVNGQGVGDNWYVLDATGTPIEQ